MKTKTDMTKLINEVQDMLAMASQKLAATAPHGAAPPKRDMAFLDYSKAQKDAADGIDPISPILLAA